MTRLLKILMLRHSKLSMLHHPFRFYFKILRSINQAIVHTIYYRLFIGTWLRCASEKSGAHVPCEIC